MKSNIHVASWLHDTDTDSELCHSRTRPLVHLPPPLNATSQRLQHLSHILVPITLAPRPVPVPDHHRNRTPLLHDAFPIPIQRRRHDQCRIFERLGSLCEHVRPTAIQVHNEYPSTARHTDEWVWVTYLPSVLVGAPARIPQAESVSVL